ncbi:hypothetical protein ALQ80_00913 [Pseudomonas coronafaciens pv. oryzae]|nr:hypothetical protein ALQ80_00913 [Pseudomonas coronafaciens pv. oryzae]
MMFIERLCKGVNSAAMLKVSIIYIQYSTVKYISAERPELLNVVNNKKA